MNERRRVDGKRRRNKIKRGEVKQETRQRGNKRRRLKTVWGERRGKEIEITGNEEGRGDK